MIDPDLILRRFLLTRAPLTALTGSRLFADSHLPSGYRPSDGPALCLAVRGGGIDYTSRVLSPSFQLEAYAATPALSRRLAAVLVDQLDGAATHLILAAALETTPVLLRDPVTGWDYVLSFYQLTLLNEGGT